MSRSASETRALHFEGADWEVDYDYSPYVPAKTWGAPEDCSPAEGGECELNEVRLEGGDVDLMQYLDEGFLERLEQHVEELAAEESGEDDDYDE